MPWPGAKNIARASCAEDPALASWPGRRGDEVSTRQVIDVPSRVGRCFLGGGGGANIAKLRLAGYIHPLSVGDAQVQYLLNRDASGDA